jgi:flagellar L-ring protein precursor FlgH
MKTILILSLFLLTSCAGYVNSLHKQMDEPKKRSVNNNSNTGRYDPYAPYRRIGQRNKDKRPIHNPITYQNIGNKEPPVKRNYIPADKRYKSDDFIDGDNSGSLWTNQGTSSHLFSGVVQKRIGDIVVVNVMENLRNQISAEMKRAFPDPPKKKVAAKDDKKKDNVQAAQAAPAKPADDEADSKVFDKVSGTIVEEVSKDYLLVKGRKEITFKKEKRFIEVQSLVSRRDISDNDSINSDKVLESRVIVLR